MRKISGYFHILNIKLIIYCKKFIYILKYGRPDIVLDFGGGIGDHLLMTTVAHELKERGVKRIFISSNYNELYYNNNSIKASNKNFSKIFSNKVLNLNYSLHIRSERRDIPPKNHIIEDMCAKADIKGEIKLTPYIYLDITEKKFGSFFKNQIAIQSSGMAAQNAMITKEWFFDYYQKVIYLLKEEFSFVQIGSKTDPLLENVLDMRGKTTIRETASILYNSELFVGQVSLLMHLAKAVNCRSIIIYGGRELPFQSGYICNSNLSSIVDCSPCWKYECDQDRKCLRKITPEFVASEIVLTYNDMKNKKNSRV